MIELGSYAIADFVPFTADVYFRLLERASQDWWPLHALTLSVGIAAAGLALRGWRRTAAAAMAAALAWSGGTFLMGGYARLNWAGEGFGLAFLAASAILVLAGLQRPGRASGRGLPVRHGAPASRGFSVSRGAGLALMTLGVAAYPLIAPLSGYGWQQAEVFGIHPDPTAIATLGVALLILQGWRLWLASVIPLLWCLVSALTLQVLQAPWAFVLAGAIAVALSGVIADVPGDGTRTGHR